MVERFKALQADIHKTWKRMGRNEEVNLHLSKAVNHLFSHSQKPKSKEQLMKQLHPPLKKALQKVKEYEAHISSLEAQYQELLEHPSLSLETRVALESNLKGHVQQLRSLHTKRETTLLKVSKLFLDEQKKS